MRVESESILHQVGNAITIGIIEGLYRIGEIDTAVDQVRHDHKADAAVGVVIAAVGWCKRHRK